MPHIRFTARNQPMRSGPALKVPVQDDLLSHLLMRRFARCFKHPSEQLRHSMTTGFPDAQISAYIGHGQGGEAGGAAQQGCPGSLPNDHWGQRTK